MLARFAVDDAGTLSGTCLQSEVFEPTFPLKL
jgi:hypothetical protein